MGEGGIAGEERKRNSVIYSAADVLSNIHLVSPFSILITSWVVNIYDRHIYSSVVPWHAAMSSKHVNSLASSSTHVSFIILIFCHSHADMLTRLQNFSCDQSM